MAGAVRVEEAGSATVAGGTAVTAMVAVTHTVLALVVEATGAGATVVDTATHTAAEAIMATDITDVAMGDTAITVTATGVVRYSGLDSAMSLMDGRATTRTDIQFRVMRIHPTLTRCLINCKHLR